MIFEEEGVDIVKPPVAVESTALAEAGGFGAGPGLMKSSSLKFVADVDKDISLELQRLVRARIPHLCPSGDLCLTLE